MEEQSGKDAPCGLCQAFAPTKEGPATSTGFQLDYGTPAQLKTRQDCPICRLILKMLPSDRPTTQNTAVTAAQGRVLIAGGLNEGLRVFHDDHYRGLIRSEPPANAFLETPCLKFHLIKDWIKKCEDYHQDDISALAPRYKHPVEIILIDVADQNLVRASSSWRFLTISYVWGKTALETTTTANRRAREQQGALSKVNLPQLILDAMLLVSQLGERYLWVDCLCIEQDNPSQKHSQVSQMDVIYSQSLLTLVALSSENARSFLPGTRAGTRSFFKAKEYVFDRYIYAIYPRLLEFSEAAVYESRGWTFQERLLSRRCLFLTECDMYYTCHSCLWRETGANSATGEEKIFENKFRNIFAQLDSFRQEGKHGWVAPFRLYASLVHEYSTRELSYDTDVINAFSGISSVLGYFLNSSSVSGLIECVLDACLLWVPGNSNTHDRNSKFPSWSWAGWRGEVFYLLGPIYAYSADYDKYNSSQFLLISLVDKFETQSMSPLRPILRLLQHQRNSAIAKVEFENATKGLDLLSFEAITADIMQLDLSSEESVVRGDICRNSNETHSRSIRIFKIMDANQQRCGYLHSFPGTPSPPPQAQTYRELVALSVSQLDSTRSRPMAVLGGSSIESDNYSILFDRKTFKRKPWCLLNIMLVEWKGSEAERVTIGQIHIDAWDTLETQRKRIRLI
jgi:Heterokaryon incompatibility protein (HET)